MTMTWLVTIVILALGGCSSTTQPSASSPASETTRRASTLDPLPASFAGDLPCADCPGIRYSLNLFPDRAFFLSLTYEERNEGVPFYDIGTWDLSSDRRVLALKGGDEAPQLFRIVDANTIRLLDAEGREIETSLNYTLKRSAPFERIEPSLPMRGMYQYMADAGLFTECLSRQRWSVAQKGANADLEHAYLKARHEPGEKLLVELEGRVVMHPSMEGDALQPTLIVDRFIDVQPVGSCGPRFATASLEHTSWILTKLKGEPVIAQEPTRAPSLTLHPDQQRVSGSGGCNRLMGRYTLERQKIRIDQMARTKMACPDGMDTEQAFLEALERARTWNVIGRHLELYDAGGALLARLEAGHIL